jgi:hypothetical protein
MATIPKSLIQAVAKSLARLPIDPADLAAVAASVEAQADGLAKLQELDLLTIEPATVCVPPREVPHAE